MSNAQITATHESVATSGVNLQDFDVATQALFKVSVSRYGKIVKPGETLNGSDWASRIWDTYVQNAMTMRAVECILRVMGGELRADEADEQA